MMRSSHTALHEFGYSFLSPMLNHYIRKIAQAETGCRIVCLAREGWIFHKLINTLKVQNLFSCTYEPIYLKVSRTLLFRSQLGNAEVMKVALEGKFEGSVLDLMMKRFGLQLHEVHSVLPSELLTFKVTLPDDTSKVMKWFEPHHFRLANFVEPTRTAVHHYLNEELGGDSLPLMLDIGYAGTIQKLITRIIKRDTRGLYFIANTPGPTQVESNIAHMSGAFKENIKWSQGYLMLEKSLLLESLITAPHGQVTDIRIKTDGKLEFLYGMETAPQRYSQDLETVMQGAITGVAEGLRDNIEYSVEDIESLYAGFAESPSAIPRDVYHLFKLDDEFSGKGMVSPLQLFGMH